MNKNYVPDSTHPVFFGYILQGKSEKPNYLSKKSLACEQKIKYNVECKTL